MEIEQKIYEQYRDTPYKLEGQSHIQENANQNEQNIQNSHKIGAYKEYLKEINESINEPHRRRIRDSITIIRNNVNTNQNNIQNNHLNSNNNIDKNNADIQISLKEPCKFNLDQNEKEVTSLISIIYIIKRQNMKIIINIIIIVKI